MKVRNVKIIDNNFKQWQASKNSQLQAIRINITCNINCLQIGNIETMIIFLETVQAILLVIL